MLILGKAWIGWLPSSTAQGGGGSFKDRKPIGDVSCCDEANPLMERRVAEDLSFSFSLFASCLSLSNCLYLSIYYVSGHVSIYLNICLSVCLSVWLAVCLSICLFVHQSICHLPIYISVCENFRAFSLASHAIDPCNSWLNHSADFHRRIGTKVRTEPRLIY